MIAIARTKWQCRNSEEHIKIYAVLCLMCVEVCKKRIVYLSRAQQPQRYGFFGAKQNLRIALHLHVICVLRLSAIKKKMFTKNSLKAISNMYFCYLCKKYLFVQIGLPDCDHTKLFKKKNWISQNSCPDFLIKTTYKILEFKKNI